MGANWEVVNLGTNGTYLDGKRIDKSMVGDGSIIRLARSGPNIKIRLGIDGVDDTPTTLEGDRPFGQRSEVLQMPTEITEQGRPFISSPGSDGEPRQD